MDAFFGATGFLWHHVRSIPQAPPRSGQELRTSFLHGQAAVVLLNPPLPWAGWARKATHPPQRFHHRTVSRPASGSRLKSEPRKKSRMTVPSQAESILARPAFCDRVIQMHRTKIDAKARHTRSVRYARVQVALRKRGSLHPPDKSDEFAVRAAQVRLHAVAAADPPW